MSKFDENLFGRIAVINHQVTKEQLEECLEIKRERGSSTHIGNILFEKGYLTREEFQRIVEIRNKKVRKLLRSQEDSQKADQEFGRHAIRENLLDLDQLETAALEQQQMRQFNLHFSLPEVVYSRGMLSARAVLDVLGELGIAMRRCAICDFQYQITDARDGEIYHCPKCDATLQNPAYLDPVLVEGVVEPSSLEARRVERDSVRFGEA
ncbi:MAG: hypothetical protein AAF517_20035 [Planctomycetota bacterium]